MKNGRFLITVANGLPVIVPSQSKTIPLLSELNQAGGRPNMKLPSTPSSKSKLKEGGGEDLKIW